MIYNLSANAKKRTLLKIIQCHGLASQKKSLPREAAYATRIDEVLTKTQGRAYKSKK